VRTHRVGPASAPDGPCEGSSTLLLDGPSALLKLNSNTNLLLPPEAPISLHSAYVTLSSENKFVNGRNDPAIFGDLVSKSPYVTNP
jgi:hypothetical protein